MTDTAPSARTGRLVARLRVGRTGSEDAARRYVSTNTIAVGETFADLVNHRAVTLPYEAGCLNLYVDGPDGALPTENMRYSPDNAAGSPVETKLHFDGAGRADGTIVDGGAILSWLGSGKSTFAAAMAAQGRWWGTYNGKMRSPSFQPTNAAPHNWPADVSRSTMDSLANWRTWHEWALAGGAAWMACDADAPSLSTDPAAYLQTMLETPGTYDGTALGVPGYSGSFTNDRARKFYVEARPRAGHWAHSFIAIASTFELHEGDPAWMQVADCTHPPMILCTQEEPDLDYANAMAYLTERRDVLVVVNFDELYDAGKDMGALVEASSDEETDEGTPGQGSEDVDDPFFRPRRLPTLPSSRYQRLTPRIGP